MSQEITYQSQIYLRNGGLFDTYASGSLTANQAAAALVRNVQNVTTSAPAQALDLGSVATPGWAVIINTEVLLTPPVVPANYVQVGSYVGGTFYPFMRLYAGEVQMCRLAIAAPYALAVNASTNLFYIIYEA